MRFRPCCWPLIAAALVALAARPAVSASRTVYRLYIPVRAYHFYLADPAERDAAIAQGARFEGTAMCLSSDPLPGRAPLYHLFEPGLQKHHYASSSAERSSLLARGWQDLGILGYLWAEPALGRFPLYRLFHPALGDHLITMDIPERDAAVGAGYVLEGVLGYVDRPFPYLSVAQAEFLEGMLKTHLQYFLDARTVTAHGFPLAAFKTGDRARFGYGTPADMGYALQAWIAGAERGAISLEQAVTRITTALTTLQRLQNTFPQHAEGLFFPAYDLTDNNGQDLPAPVQDGNANIPSGDNAILYASLRLTQGWARRLGNEDLATRAAEVQSRMSFRRFLTTASGSPRLARFLNRNTGQLSAATWDVYADEGGVVTWIALVSGSISFEEFQAMTRAQQRASASFQGVTVQEAAFFNAMLPWGTRSWAGFPIGPWDAPAGTRTPFSRQSFAPSVQTHLAYGDALGIAYPAFSDSSTQARGGQRLAGRFTPANLAGQAPSTPPQDVMPHALFLPFNAGPDLPAAVRDRLLAHIDQLRTDSAGYFHPLDAAEPFGFEALASPQRNQTAYAGADAGRGVYEARANAAILLSAFTGLQVNDGCETFADYAGYLPGNRDLVSRALAFLYPSAFWEVRPSGTTADLHAVAFVGASTGYAVGDGSTILATTDGGTAWQPRALGTAGAALRFLAVLDANTLWVADSRRLWRSTNAGATWELVWTTAQPPAGAAGDVITGLGAGPGQLYLTVDYGATEAGFFVSSDGGKTWTRPAGASVLSGKMLGLVNRGATVWIWSDIGRVWRTTDGGETFTVVGRPSGPGLFFLDENLGWFATDRGTWITLNGGTLWAAQGANTDARLTRVRFGDFERGWGIGPNPGLVYFSPDSGVTWVPQGVPVSTPLQSLAVTDPDHAWIVGSGGVILRYLP